MKIRLQSDRSAGRENTFGIREFENTLLTEDLQQQCNVESVLSLEGSRRRGGERSDTDINELGIDFSSFLGLNDRRQLHLDDIGRSGRCIRTCAASSAPSASHTNTATL